MMNAFLMDMFELFGQHHSVFVHRKAGQHFVTRCIAATVKHSGDSILVWGSIYGNDMGKFVKNQQYCERECLL